MLFIKFMIMTQQERIKQLEENEKELRKRVFELERTVRQIIQVL